MEIDDLQQAIDLIRNRQPHKALPILLSIIESNPKNEMAWLWLAACTHEKELRIICLQKAVELNPNNLLAKEVLTKTQEKLKSDSIANDQKDVSTSFETSNKKINQSQEKEKRGFKTTPNGKSDLPEEKPKRKRTGPKIHENEEDIKKESPSDKNKLSGRLTRDSLKIGNNFFGLQREGIDPQSRNESGIFGNTFIVDGVRFSVFEGPPCIRLSQEIVDTLCDSCEYFSPINCLLKFDEFFVEDIKRQRRMVLEHQAKIIHRGKIVTKVIYDELKAHGRPLHYSVITRIIVARYPKLKLNERKIFRFLLWHPELFEPVGDGVFRAK